MTTDNATTTRPTTSAPRAFIRTKRPTDTAQRVELLARTGGRRNIRVREVGTPTPKVFGVYRFDLVDDKGRQVADQVFAGLPWSGAGDDPLDPEGKRVALYNMPSGKPAGAVSA